MSPTVLTSFLFLILALHCKGQEVFYYGVNNRPLDSETEAITSKILLQKSDHKYIIETQIRSDKDWTKAERQKIKVKKDGTHRIYLRRGGIFPKKFLREIKLLDHLSFYAFEESNRGNLIRSGTSNSYLPLLLDGTITEYHPNGIEKSVSVFQNNQLLSNRNWLSDGSPYIDSIFYSADQEPDYRPGVAYFQSYLLQQLAASKINLDEFDDDILIGWVVMETGVIDGVMALKGKSLELNQLLVDIISRIPGEWEPAILNGEPVRYFMSIPLTILHQEAKFQDLEYRWGVLHYNRY